jgi:hypothetical protein
MQIEISGRDIQVACRKATQYRQKVAIDSGEPAGNIAERISSTVYREARPTDRACWVEVGLVFDNVVGDSLRVYLNIDSQAVQVERPSLGSLPVAPVPQRPALIYNIYGPKHYEADPRFRYFLEGTEYTAEQAEQIASERRSVHGWTWKLKG